MQNRRCRVTCPARLAPNDCVSSGQIPLTTQLDRHEFRITVAAHYVNNVVLNNRSGNDIRTQAGGLPDYFSGFKVIRTDLARSGDNHLLAALIINHQWCRPRTDFTTTGAPQLFPVAFIQGDNKRIALLVEGQDQMVSGQGRSRTLAKLEPHPHFDTEVFLPDQFTVEVVTVYAP